jgi:uncharacterized protein with HEPN domain
MKDSMYRNRIVKCAEKIVTYMQDVSLQSFLSNDEKGDAVILNLKRIGETANKLSVDTKEQYPKIEWLGIIDLRNIISNDDYNLEIIYDIVTKDIPELLIKLSGNNS